MCSHGNQHLSSIKHPFISLYYKYQPFIFIYLPAMNSPVFPSLHDIYCSFSQLKRTDQDSGADQLALWENSLNFWKHKNLIKPAHFYSLAKRLCKRLWRKEGRKEDPEREILDDEKSAEILIYEYYGSCLATLQPPPTHILPLPTPITANAHQQRLLINRVSGLVYV